MKSALSNKDVQSTIMDNTPIKVARQEANPDRFYDLKRLQEVSCLSIRILKEHIKDPIHPLPSFKVGKKFLVRWSEFCEWLETFRVEGRDLNDIIDEITGDVS